MIFTKPLVCAICGEKDTRTGNRQKYCLNCKPLSNTLSKLNRGVTIIPFVGKGGNVKRGIEHPSYTTGIKAYRRMKQSSCECCGTTERKLEVHHKDEDRYNNDPKNLETLCRSCHTKRHPRKNKTLSAAHVAKLKEAWIRRKERANELV